MKKLVVLFLVVFNLFQHNKIYPQHSSIINLYNHCNSGSHQDLAVTSIKLIQQVPHSTLLSPHFIIKNYGKLEVSFFVHLKLLSKNQHIINSDSIFVSELKSNDSMIVSFSSVAIDPLIPQAQIILYASLKNHLESPKNISLIEFDLFQRNLVTLEIGTGTWCQFCPGAAMGADDLVNAGYSVGVLEYHMYDFFQNEGSITKINFYGITSYPTAIFDGIDRYYGGSTNQSLFDEYLNIYLSKINIPSLINVFITGQEVSNRNYALNIHIQKSSLLSNQNISLFVGVTESEILFNWYGLNKLNFVERIIIPNSNGLPIDFLNNDTLTIPLNLIVDQEWNLTNIELMAWIQDMSTMEILNARKVKLVDLSSTHVEEIFWNNFVLLQNYPNPFNPSTKIKYSMPQTSVVELKVFDILGNNIATLINEEKPAGTYELTWNAAHLPSGVYFYQLRAGDFISTKKMILMK